MDNNETDSRKKTACIICSLNCGLDIKTEGGRITKIKGDARITPAKFDAISQHHDLSFF